MRAIAVLQARQREKLAAEAERLMAAAYMSPPVRQLVVNMVNALADIDVSMVMAQQPGTACEAMCDMLEDARAEMGMVREALGVPYEPHQNLLERTLEVAQAAGRISKGD